MTAEQIIAEPLDNYQMVAQADKRAYITELLEQVGLSADDLTKYPRQFSGGQLQRINIARALALKPKLIVLDEPISSLDMVNQRLIIDLLQRLKEDFQLTYVFITHDIKAACLLSDHIAILEANDYRAVYDCCRLYRFDKVSCTSFENESVSGTSYEAHNSQLTIKDFTFV